MSKSVPSKKSRIQKKPGSQDEAGHYQQVAEAAYFLSEKRGFEPGRELDDWVVAENMVSQEQVENFSAVQ